MQQIPASPESAAFQVAPPSLMKGDHRDAEVPYWTSEPTLQNNTRWNLVIRSQAGEGRLARSRCLQGFIHLSR